MRLTHRAARTTTTAIAINIYAASEIKKMSSQKKKDEQEEEAAQMYNGANGGALAQPSLRFRAIRQCAASQHCFCCCCWADKRQQHCLFVVRYCLALLLFCGATHFYMRRPPRPHPHADCCHCVRVQRALDACCRGQDMALALPTDIVQH